MGLSRFKSRELESMFVVYRRIITTCQQIAILIMSDSRATAPPPYFILRGYQRQQNPNSPRYRRNFFKNLPCELSPGYATPDARQPPELKETRPCLIHAQNSCKNPSWVPQAASGLLQISLSHSGKNHDKQRPERNISKRVIIRAAVQSQSPRSSSRTHKQYP
jgi:hypothetical protein